jgi:hypothetical protein
MAGSAEENTLPGAACFFIAAGAASGVKSIFVECLFQGLRFRTSVWIDGA